MRCAALCEQVEERVFVGQINNPECIRTRKWSIGFFSDHNLALGNRENDRDEALDLRCPFTRPMRDVARPRAHEI